MTQLSDSIGIPFVHTVELLDWATGGPEPDSLRARRRYHEIAKPLAGESRHERMRERGRSSSAVSVGVGLAAAPAFATNYHSGADHGDRPNRSQSRQHIKDRNALHRIDCARSN
jgi:hypothetical protein